MTVRTIYNDRSDIVMLGRTIKATHSTDVPLLTVTTFTDPSLRNYRSMRYGKKSL